VQRAHGGALRPEPPLAKPPPAGEQGEYGDSAEQQRG